MVNKLYFAVLNFKFFLFDKQQENAQKELFLNFFYNFNLFVDVISS